MREYKVIITGPMGAGKTTAIKMVSEITPILTDVYNSDHSVKKATTTVGFDYGEILISENERFRLYGTPGQERFDFMWRFLESGAFGIILLLDMSRTSFLDDLDIYLRNFKDLIKKTGCVIGLSHMNAHLTDEIEDAMYQLLGEYKLLCPIVPVDVTKKTQVLWILDLLLTQLEEKVEFNV